MKQVSINKKLNFTNGSIEVRYNGIPKNENINLAKIENLLEDFLNNHRSNNMIEIVTIIRTIFKDCEEKLLVIFLSDENEAELIKYVNAELFLYEKSKREENDEYYDRYKIKYEPPYGINLEYNNPETELIDYSSVELVSKEITEILKQIYYLKSIKAVILDRNDIALIQMYKLFYNENPNFSNKDINIKVQTMMYILSEFGISLDANYGFNLWGTEKMPVSLNLKQRVNKLYPLGEVLNIEDSIKLADEPKKIIKIVGESIREVIANEQDQNEALITISKIIYASRYCISSNSDVNKLSEFTKRSTDEVKSSIKLVKRIENRIDKQI